MILSDLAGEKRGDERKWEGVSGLVALQMLADFPKLAGIEICELDADAGDVHPGVPGSETTDFGLDGGLVGNFLKANPDKGGNLPVLGGEQETPTFGNVESD
jgi:hypothetical protein